MSLLSLSPGTIVVSILFSALGMAYFVYGKKQSDFNFMLSGVLLMIYTYFMQSILWSIIIGVVLASLPKILNRF